jgi:hypothetical protein
MYQETGVEETATLCLGNPNQTVSKLIVIFIAQYDVFHNIQCFIVTDTLFLKSFTKWTFPSSHVAGEQ